MLIGVVGALLLGPSAAGAATTLYNGIVGTSGHKANVTAAGELNVHDSSAAILNGKVNVGADGRIGVDAAPIPTKFFHYTTDTASASCGNLATPSGYATVITSIHVAFYSTTNGNGNADTLLKITDGPGCSAPSLADDLYFGPLGSQELDYPTGLGIADGHVLGYASGLFSLAQITVTGYEVPSALCSGDCL